MSKIGAYIAGDYLIEHQIPLRSNVSAFVRLPRNMTAAEAVRVCEVVKALALNGREDQ